MIPSRLKQRITEDLKHDEGLRLKPYKCPSNRLTIGYGRNLEDRGITHEEADFMLQKDVEALYFDLHRAIPFFYTLPDDVQSALINMAYNIGVLGLLRFRRVLVQLELGRFDKAADQVLDSQYARQVPARAKRNADLIRNA